MNSSYCTIVDDQLLKRKHGTSVKFRLGSTWSGGLSSFVVAFIHVMHPEYSKDGLF